MEFAKSAFLPHPGGPTLPPPHRRRVNHHDAQPVVSVRQIIAMGLQFLDQFSCNGSYTHYSWRPFRAQNSSFWSVDAAWQHWFANAWSKSKEKCNWEFPRTNFTCTFFTYFNVGLLGYWYLLYLFVFFAHFILVYRLTTYIWSETFAFLRLFIIWWLGLLIKLV